jgi:hypothetical protein
MRGFYEGESGGLYCERERGDEASIITVHAHVYARGPRYSSFLKQMSIENPCFNCTDSVRNTEYPIDDLPFRKALRLAAEGNSTQHENQQRAYLGMERTPAAVAFSVLLSSFEELEFPLGLNRNEYRGLQSRLASRN